MNKPLKAIIVEDELASREILSGYIKKYTTDVEVVALAENVEDGLKAVEKHNPDILFLDIEMPYGNGFDLLEKVKEVNFETIFVTAYANYAIKALNSSASYYLLKPIDIDELEQAVNKIKASYNEENGISHTKVLLENIQIENKQLHKVVCPTMTGFDVVRVKDIIRCEANDNFTEFHLTNGPKMMICRSLKFYEEVLSDMDFIRVHKSHLVNGQHIKQYIKGKGGQLVMSDDSIVNISPSKKAILLNYFK
ncbi:MAG: DNA-binding response regulator [Flavobacteriales bacterium]|nr:DNA-binding response regulator [Flavobacteriales bacterium]|tara:strand:+ start:1400 stop:2152 length:753 start_codon:yes stop_codon:yes gene_type:complete